MPPLSCPTASIFCAVARCSCVCFRTRCASIRSLMSRVTLEFTGLIADRIDHDERTKPATVLANAPSLRLKAALARRDRQDLLRTAGFTIFFGIEATEVLANDFAGS